MIELSKTKNGWEGIYLGQLTQPLELASSDSVEGQTPVHYSPGDSYPLHKVKGKKFSVLQRDKRLIAMKSGNGIHFVIDAESIDDTKKSALKQVQSQLAKAYSNGHRISKITVTNAGHVVYVFNNEAFFAGYAPEGAEGFVF